MIEIGLTAWIFVRRFIVALDTWEALGAELEARVQEKHAELERTYERLRRLEQERAAAHERERMQADLHDGLGGQLVSALAMLRSGRPAPEEIEGALQAALDDRRLLIHSLEGEEDERVGALATLRARLVPRLERAGLRIDWEVEEVPAPAGFGSERTLHVMRIVQEAIANVLTHAGAARLCVRVGVDGRDGARDEFVSIEDDGHGLGAAGASGRGLANMRRRAAALGGGLDFDSGPSGTSVRLLLPLERQGPPGRRPVGWEE